VIRNVHIPNAGQKRDRFSKVARLSSGRWEVTDLEAR